MDSTEQKLTTKTIYSAAIVTVMPLLYGIGITIVQALDKSVIKGFNMPDNKFNNWTYTILFIGSMISNWFFYCIQLQKTVVFSISYFLFGAGFIAMLYENIYSIYLSRFTIGLAAGIIGNSLPCYLSLISPLRYRSIFSSLYSVGLISGLFLFNVLLGTFKAHLNACLICITVVSLVFAVLSLTCIKLYPAKNNLVENSLPTLIANPKATKSLLLIAAFHFAQNMSGINQLSLSPETIYGSNYQTHIAANLVIGLVVSFLSGFIAEKIGRKPLTLVSCVIVTVACVLLHFDIKAAQSAYLLSFGFNVGLSNIPFVLLAEIFPENFIEPGALFGTTCNYLSSIISIQVPQKAIRDPDCISFIVYAISTAAFFLLVLALFRETMGIKPRFQ